MGSHQSTGSSEADVARRFGWLPANTAAAISAGCSANNAVSSCTEPTCVHGADHVGHSHHHQEVPLQRLDLSAHRLHSCYAARRMSRLQDGADCNHEMDDCGTDADGDAAALSVKHWESIKQLIRRRTDYVIAPCSAEEVEPTTLTTTWKTTSLVPAGRLSSIPVRRCGARDTISIDFSGHGDAMNAAALDVLLSTRDSPLTHSSVPTIEMSRSAAQPCGNNNGSTVATGTSPRRKQRGSLSRPPPHIHVPMLLGVGDVLQELHLSGCSLGAAGARILADRLFSVRVGVDGRGVQRTLLNGLSMSLRVVDAGWLPMQRRDGGRTTRTATPNLRCVCLDHCELGDEGVRIVTRPLTLMFLTGAQRLAVWQRAASLLCFDVRRYVDEAPTSGTVTGGLSGDSELMPRVRALLEELGSITSTLPRLQTLSLSRNNVTDASCEDLSALLRAAGELVSVVTACDPLYSELLLAACGDDRHAEEEGNDPKSISAVNMTLFGGLADLRIDGNPIGDDGAIQLAFRGWFPRMQLGGASTLSTSSLRSGGSADADGNGDHPAAMLHREYPSIPQGHMNAIVHDANKCHMPWSRAGSAEAAANAADSDSNKRCPRRITNAGRAGLAARSGTRGLAVSLSGTGATLVSLQALLEMLHQVHEEQLMAAVSIEESLSLHHHHTARLLLGPQSQEISSARSVGSATMAIVSNISARLDACQSLAEHVLQANTASLVASSLVAHRVRHCTLRKLCLDDSPIGDHGVDALISSLERYSAASRSVSQSLERLWERCWSLLEERVCFVGSKSDKAQVGKTKQQETLGGGVVSDDPMLYVPSRWEEGLRRNHMCFADHGMCLEELSLANVHMTPAGCMRICQCLFGHEAWLRALTTHSDGGSADRDLWTWSTDALREACELGGFASCHGQLPSPLPALKMLNVSRNALGSAVCAQLLAGATLTSLFQTREAEDPFRLCMDRCGVTDDSLRLWCTEVSAMKAVQEACSRQRGQEIPLHCSEGSIEVSLTDNTLSQEVLAAVRDVLAGLRSGANNDTVGPQKSQPPSARRSNPTIDVLVNGSMVERKQGDGRLSVVGPRAGSSWRFLCGAAADKVERESDRLSKWVSQRVEKCLQSVASPSRTTQRTPCAARPHHPSHSQRDPVKSKTDGAVDAPLRDIPKNRKLAAAPAITALKTNTAATRYKAPKGCAQEVEGNPQRGGRKSQATHKARCREPFYAPENTQPLPPSKPTGHPKSPRDEQHREMSSSDDDDGGAEFEAYRQRVNGVPQPVPQPIEQLFLAASSPPCQTPPRRRGLPPKSSATGDGSTGMFSPAMGSGVPRSDARRTYHRGQETSGNTHQRHVNTSTAAAPGAVEKLPLSLSTPVRKDKDELRRRRVNTGSGCRHMVGECTPGGGSSHGNVAALGGSTSRRLGASSNPRYGSVQGPATPPPSACPIRLASMSPEWELPPLQAPPILLDGSLLSPEVDRFLAATKGILQAADDNHDED